MRQTKGQLGVLREGEAARVMAMDRGPEGRHRPLKRSVDKECKRIHAGREMWWKVRSKSDRERIWLQSSMSCPALAVLHERQKI